MCINAANLKNINATRFLLEITITECFITMKNYLSMTLCNISCLFSGALCQMLMHLTWMMYLIEGKGYESLLNGITFIIPFFNFKSCNIYENRLI